MPIKIVGKAVITWPVACPGTAQLVLWVWNFPLCGGQFPSYCLTLDSSYLLGEIFPCPGCAVNFLYCLSMCVIWHLASPTLFLSSAAWEGYVQFIALRQLSRETPLAMGDWSTLEMMILLHLFSFLRVKHCSNQGLVCWVLLNNSEPIEDAMGQAVWDHTSGGWHCYTLWHPLHSENLHQRLVAGSSCSTKMKPSFWFKKSQSRVIWNSYEHLAATQNALKSVSSKMWNILLRGLRLIWPILIPILI